MVTSVSTTKLDTNPYVGPRAFKTGEHLYGRTREFSELVDLLIAERIVLLYSPSGAGKSSLINAMVIPKMQEEGFMVPPIVRVNLEPLPGSATHPGFNRYASSMMRSLEDQISAEGQYPADKLAEMSLAAYIKEYRQRSAVDPANFDPKSSMLLIIDQFEEVLRVSTSDQDAKTAFFAQLGEMLRDRSIWALIAIREDYLAAFDQYSRPIPNRLSVTYRLDFLDGRAAIEAIQGPARESGVTFEDDAARKLVDDLRIIRVQQADGTATEEHGPYVEPVQLQVVCRRLWDKAAEKKVITLQDVSGAGNIDDALSDYYSEHVESAAADSGVSERQIREWFDRKLITVIGIRGQVLMEPETSSGMPNKAIKFLQEAYLVRADKRGNAIWFELAHDRLTRPIRRNNAAWFADHLSVFQRQADLWNTQGRPDALLLRGPAYLEAEIWAKEHAGEILPAEKEFLEDCHREHQNMVRSRRLNIITRIALGLTIILAGVAVYFSVQAKKAADNANQQKAVAVAAYEIAKEQSTRASQKEQDALNSSKVAKVRELAAQALSSLAVDPELSITLALGAVQDVDTTQPEMAKAVKSVTDALRQALPAMRVERVFNDPSLGAADNPVSHAGTVWSASFDVNGGRVATAGNDGSIKIWNTTYGNIIKTIEVFAPAAGEPGVTSVAFSRDGKLLAAATGDGRILLYDAESFAQVNTISAGGQVIRSIAFSPDSTHLASGGASGVAQIWNVTAGDQPLSLPDVGGAIQSVAYSPDGTRVAAGDENGAATVWDAGTGRILNRLKGHNGAVNGVAFSPDGTRLASSGADRLIKIWDLAADGKEQVTISGHHDWIYAIAFTQDGLQLISVSADRTIRFWDTTHGRPGMVLYGHKDQIYGLVLSPDGRRIATTSKDRTVRIWNISPEGSREFRTIENGTAVYDIALSPDGGQLVASGGDGKVHIWSPFSGRLFTTLSGHSDIVEGVAYSRDGKKIATCSRDKTAIIWDAATGKELLTLTGHKDIIWGIAFNEAGDQVATASQDQTVNIWDAETGEIVRTLKSEWGSAITVAYSPDGSLLAAGYAGGQVVLWDAKTGGQLKVLSGHTDMVQALAFRPDSQVLASGGDDGNILLWDMNPDRWGDVQAPLRARGDAIFDLAFNKDGKHLFSVGADGIGTLWDLEQRAKEFETYGQTDRLYAAALSPDDKYLYTGGRDGTLRSYVFSFDDLLKLARTRTTRQFTEDECRQFLNAACPVDVTGAPQQPAVVTELKHPGNVPAPTDPVAHDADSSGTTGGVSQEAGDKYYVNLLERPFSDMQGSIYYPDVDILSATRAEDPEWMYFTVSLEDRRSDGLLGSYGIELDMDGDGQGDYLITTLAPGPEWSTSGVRIWQDKNRDVGNGNPNFPDPPQKGDGYETLLFDQGSGDAPDLAWARIDPNDPKSVQIALQRTITGRDSNFIWSAWASRDPFTPPWFEYIDHFAVAPDAAGAAPILDQQGNPLLELVGVDNTCRSLVPAPDTAPGEGYCQ